MISKLVTVTCKNDVSAMIRLAESIQKYFSPCEHLVIIEDKEFDEVYWVEHLGKYYTNHKLTLKSYNKLLNFERSGWHRQQALKLLASLDCQDKYLILDSKDFFIRPTHISDWENFMGSNRLQDVGYFVKPHVNLFLKFSLIYADYFKTDLMEVGFESITPFVIDSKFIDKNKIHGYAKDLLILDDNISEFTFYSYMARQLFEDFKPHKFKTLKLWGWWYNSYNDADICLMIEKNLLEATNDENVVAFGIHRDAIKHFTLEQKQTINNWIRSVGLVTEI